ncbi:ABC transporter permease [Roseivirga sp. E12]|uniref:ABC transporter permease n=1 Tax=Roseivirga sp. E12 TaxID=2819237 RepID=UPI001ABCBE76|nr:ABC transporter permease [Roseivirga sp. E12]MBO3698182.1 ABC transporter permease [Roseivirga sp. E12]
MSRKNKSPRPPRFAKWLLESFCSYDFLSTALWDLEELFHHNIKVKGLSKARFFYTMEVLGIIIHLFFKGKSQYSTNKTAMLKHNLLISIRSFKRFKSTFLINLFGLAIGLASALLIYLWVNDELHMDQLGEKDSDRHYQILVNTAHPSGIQTKTMAPTPMSQAMASELPEIDYTIPIVNVKFYQGILSYKNQYVRAQQLFVGSRYFDVFPCDFVSGNKETAFDDKNGITISESMAISLFGNSANAIGQTVDFKSVNFNGPYTVSGVFRPDKNISLDFDILMSFDQFLTARPEMKKWYNGGTETHLVLKEGVDIELFNSKIKDYLHTKEFQSKSQTLFIQKYTDRYLYGQYVNGEPTAGRMVNVRIFSLIAIVVLVIACINYMNLSTAQASRRIKEIGIKKAVGAQRRSLVYQHFAESIFMTSLSLILSVGIVLLLLPKFNEITAKDLSIFGASGVILPVLGITLLTGLVSGIYPGIYLSGFNTVLALKGKLNPGSGALSLRKVLVVFQFMISATLIISAVVIHSQINFVQQFNLGYDTEHLISFQKEGKLRDSPEIFIQEVKNIPGVANASSMGGNLGIKVSSRYNLEWKGQNPDDKGIWFHFVDGGYDIAEMLGVELKSGRLLSTDFPSDKKAIVINETAAEVLGFDNPIGEKLYVGPAYTIVGIIKDFHFQGMHEKIQPFFFRLDSGSRNIMVKLSGDNQAKTLKKIEALHSSFNPGYPFEFRFIDDNYQKLYDEERRISSLSDYFAMVAIVISCLGLLALTAFSTQRRFKEIAIRKVLGSKNSGIIHLLSKEFLILIAIAITAALPIGYYLMKDWLDGFAFRIDLQPFYFILSGLIMLIVAWLTIAAQTAKSVKINITDSLRSE